jgi:PEP-CTERM motif
MGFKHLLPKHPPQCRRNISTRSCARELVPAIPLPAIFGFAIVGFGGAFFLSYSPFRSADASSSGRSPNNVPVYSARAVPLDSEKATIAWQDISVPVRGTMTASESQNVATGESVLSRLLASESTRSGFNGFDGFSTSKAPSIYLAFSGVPMGVGVNGTSSSPAHAAPDAESLSSVPEPSTWLAGAALVTLVGARWFRSRWRRSQRSPR